jgi:hypothetical protein
MRHVRTISRTPERADFCGTIGSDTQARLCFILQFFVQFLLPVMLPGVSAKSPTTTTTEGEGTITAEGEGSS